jgi:hypothetical protein
MNESQTATGNNAASLILIFVAGNNDWLSITVLSVVLAHELSLKELDFVTRQWKYTLTVKLPGEMRTR